MLLLLNYGKIHPFFSSFIIVCDWTLCSVLMESSMGWNMLCSKDLLLQHSRHRKEIIDTLNTEFLG